MSEKRKKKPIQILNPNTRTQLEQAEAAERGAQGLPEKEPVPEPVSRRKRRKDGAQIF